MGKKSTRAQRAKDTAEWKNQQIDKITQTRRKRRVQRLKAWEPQIEEVRLSSVMPESYSISAAVESRYNPANRSISPISLGSNSESVHSRASSPAALSRASSPVGYKPNSPESVHSRASSPVGYKPNSPESVASSPLGLSRVSNRSSPASGSSTPEVIIRGVSNRRISDAVKSSHVYEAVAEPPSRENQSRSVILDWENDEERENAKGPRRSPSEDEETNLKRLVEEVDRRNHMKNVEDIYERPDMVLPGNIRLPGNKCKNAKLLQFPINRLLLEAKIRNLNEKSCIGRGGFCGVLALYLLLPEAEVSRVESIIKTRSDICENGLPYNETTSALEDYVSGIKICNQQENYHLIGYKDLRGYFHMPRQFDTFQEQIEHVLNNNSITMFYISDRKMAHLACIAKLDGVCYMVDPAFFCKSGGMMELNRTNFEKYLKSLDHTDTSHVYLHFQPDNSPVSKKRSHNRQPINKEQINSLGPVSPIRKQKDEKLSKRRRMEGGKYTRRI